MYGSGDSSISLGVCAPGFLPILITTAHPSHAGQHGQLEDAPKNDPALTPCVVCPDRRYTQSRAWLAEPMSPKSPAVELPQGPEGLHLLLSLHCCLPTWAPKPAKSKGGKRGEHPRSEISPAVLGQCGTNMFSI